MKYFLVVMIIVGNLYGVVSISPVEIGDNPGFKGEVDGALDTKRGNTDSDSYTASMKLTYDNNVSYVVWSELSFTYGEASGVKNANKTFAHIRYIHKLKKNLDWEAFVQSQSNEFTKVDERLLGGGDLRIHVHSNRLGTLYFGVGGFFEYITYTTSIDPNENNVRASIYGAYKKAFTQETELSYLLYYQPKMTNFNDYILLNILELKVLVYKQLFIHFNINYREDSRPAIGVKSLDISQTTSFSYTF